MGSGDIRWGPVERGLWPCVRLFEIHPILLTLHRQSRELSAVAAIIVIVVTASYTGQFGSALEIGLTTMVTKTLSYYVDERLWSTGN